MRKALRRAPQAGGNGTMSERALRGTRLGATSYETDSGIDLAPRQDVEYSCSNGHRFDMPFALEAEVPPTWECRICGGPALRVDGAVPEERPGKPTRTHWDMLLERRSVADLEEVLAERLEVLRTGGISYGGMSVPPVDPAGRPAARPAPGSASGTAAAKNAPAKKSSAPASKAPATKSPGRPAKKAPAGKASSPAK
jgi:hypothetical protein